MISSEGEKEVAQNHETNENLIRLLDVIELQQASRAESIKLMPDYLKKDNIQDLENKQYFTPKK